MKTIIKLSSHSLSAFQRCERLFYYNTLRKIEPRRINPAFERGKIIAKCLEEYYDAKVASLRVEPKRILEISERNIEASELNELDKILLSRRFMEYTGYYRQEEWVPLGTEVSFSIVLYEDKNVCFIYEGTIDLVALLDKKTKRRIVVDHKSYSREADLYEYENQPMGYCHAMKTDTFYYNYFGLTETKKAKDNFYRDGFIYKKEQLDDWLNTTLRWYRRIYTNHLLTRHIKDPIEGYIQSKQCSGKYGLCTMHTLCETVNPRIREYLVQIDYKKSDYGSWNQENESAIESIAS